MAESALGQQLLCPGQVFIYNLCFQFWKYDAECNQNFLGGRVVLGKLPVLGHPSNLDNSEARAYCACSRCGRGLFGHFFPQLSLLFSFSPFLAQYRLKYCLKGPLNPQQPTNQYSKFMHFSLQSIFVCLI